MYPGLKQEVIIQDLPIKASNKRGGGVITPNIGSPCSSSSEVSGF